MQQSNSLRKIEEILSKAVNTGENNTTGGYVLLTTMNLEHDKPENLIYFYELLGRAKEEAKSIKNQPNIDRYIQSIDVLHEKFIINHIWTSQWNIFSSYIKSANVLNTLDSLAIFFGTQNPVILLNRGLLDELNSKLKELLEEINSSDLSRESKRFMVERIENIITAINKYDIDGTKGVEQATKSFISDLVMNEHNLKDSDKSNPICNKVVSVICSVLLFVKPTPWDIIGVMPDLNDFWMPRIESFTEVCGKIESAIVESSTIQQAFEKASYIVLHGEQQKTITGGKELKALPASIDGSKTNEKLKNE
jgi:hypothetical protein